MTLVDNLDQKYSPEIYIEAQKLYDKQNKINKLLSWELLKLCQQEFWVKIAYQQDRKNKGLPV